MVILTIDDGDTMTQPVVIPVMMIPRTWIGNENALKASSGPAFDWELKRDHSDKDKATN